MLTVLAARLGARVELPRCRDVPPPTLFELALDNAREGQVGETIGALVATCQARAAPSSEVRALFASIARDEARHAGLAHRLAPWLASRLSAGERAEVDAARRAAISKAEQDPGAELDDANRAWLGLPAPGALVAAQREMFAMLIQVPSHDPAKVSRSPARARVVHGRVPPRQAHRPLGPHTR